MLRIVSESFPSSLKSFLEPESEFTSDKYFCFALLFHEASLYNNSIERFIYQHVCLPMFGVSIV